MRKLPLGNRDLIRAINRSAVLNSIKALGPVSRTQIAKRTGLSAATITGISADLIGEKLVFEKEEGVSRGGRRPILLAINPNGAFVIGLKLTETRAIGALTDLEASLLARQTLTVSGRSPDAVVSSLAVAVQSLLTEAHVRRERLLGVGVGVAGIVDGENGLLRQSPFLGWKDVALRDLLQSRIGTPVYIENDVNTLTIAERWFGAGQGVDDFLTVTIGRGVGLGVVANGMFYRGARGGAGEFGHTVIDPDGEACACGKKGCLETIVGDPGLLRMAQELGLKVKRPAELVRIASSGDSQARAVFARAGVALGQAIANLINLFDPQLIIISGEGTRAQGHLFDPMREAIRQHVMPGLADDTEIRIHPWDDDAWARGAASVVLRELFESPVHRVGEGAPA